MSNLCSDHIKDLKKSGLNDETITDANIESIPPTALEIELGMTLYHLDGAYRIPFDDAYSRFKLFYSSSAPPAKRPKYIQKKGATNRLYIPLGISEEYLKGKAILYITEGEKKALKATQEGLPCVAVTGLWNWKRKGSDELISDFDKITLSGRSIVLVPDNDWLDLSKDGKPRHLDDAVYRLATALMLRGAIVRIAYLPKDGSTKIGLDDYLINHSSDEFRKLKLETCQASPCFLLQKGNLVFYKTESVDGGDGPVITFAPPVTISAAVEIVAYTRNGKNEDWGRMLSFSDKDHINHTWAMPMEMLAGDGKELRSELLRRGLPYITTGKNRGKLLEYIQLTPPVNGTRSRCIDRTGWHTDKLFILPDRAIGNSGDEPVVFQGKTDSIIFQHGTHDEWKSSIGTLCRGNSRLMFAVAMAFTAPLLHLVGADNIGVNFFGSSSTGKTTALRVACSVWGSKDYMLRWRATGNGLEGVATAHNDLFMGLDELAQVSPFEAGEIAYMLANGTGKTRAGRDGEARQSKRWRTCFLSTGEITLAEHVAAGGKKVKAGQEVRLLDIPADTGIHGVFEELHGYQNGNKLSVHLNNTVAEYYGTVGITFIEHIIDGWDELPEFIKTKQREFIAEYTPKGADGQVQRVAGFFGLIAAAGEIATIYELTGWDESDATTAVKKCFEAWIEQRGGVGAREVDRIIEDVKLFIEQHGSSRFVDSDGNADRIVTNRAGYRKGNIFYILPEVFKKEVLKGHNDKFAKKVLVEHKILLPDIAAKRTDQTYRPHGEPTLRVYAIDSSSLLGFGAPDDT
ncbi:MAG: DUF927 domain-containing protein [Desulfuromonadaceae bacterium]|nr:DUF927 domain-containing protein [Desulfuromonadaceae bacterium]